MLRLRTAIVARCLQRPLKQTLQRAAEIGVSGLKFDARNELKASDLSKTGRRQFLHAMRELGLSVASLDFPTRRTLADPDQLDRRLAALKETMQFASQLKSTVVTARVGRIPSEPDTDEFRNLAAILNDLARYGNQEGVTLAIQTPRSRPASLVRLIQEVTEGPLGVNFDPAGMISSDTSPADAFRELHACAAQVVVRDALRDVDTIVEVPLGRGEVPWDELLALFEEANYSGWLTIDRTQGEDPPGDVVRAVEYLKHLSLG